MKYTFEQLKEIRHHLHANPELSGQEKATASFVKEQLIHCNPTDIIEEIGGYGIVATFDSGKKGPSVLFRTDMDALPILEETKLDYVSKNKGVAHKCGHDGHLTMMLGLAGLISEKGIDCGKVHLLFQPAEEIGQGAFAMLKDSKMANINPDFVFAYHNVPGIEKGTAIIKENGICAASVGMRIKLIGKTAHAAEPENGVSPIPVLMKLIAFSNELPLKEFNDFVLSTPVYMKLGEDTYGISPGEALLSFTLRASSQTDFEKLKQLFQDKLKTYSNEANIDYEISWEEEFPATENDIDAVKIIENAVQNLELKTSHPKDGFRWSEDFGHFTSKYKGALIGLGSGINQPSLHHPTYDFPDGILTTGINLYYQILIESLKYVS